MSSEQSYFFRASLAERASLVIGLPSISAFTEADILQTIAHYAKQHSILDLPNPYDLFGMNVHTGIVSWEEHKNFKKSSSNWPQILGNSVLLEGLRSTYVDPPPRGVVDLSLNRPTQGRLSVKPENC